MKRIMFVTDSLGAPRSEDEIVSIDDTWCYLVKKYDTDNNEYFFDTVNGFDTKNLVDSSSKKIKLYKPNQIILQVGIVDCAPRALKKNELRVIRHMGFFSKIVNKIIKNNYSEISKVRNISYVKLDQFEKNLVMFCSQFENTEIFAVAIAKPGEKYVKKSPLIIERRKRYNDVLLKVFGENFIDPYKEIDENELEKIFIHDGYHLNSLGHSMVSKKVFTQMNKNKA